MKPLAIELFAGTCSWSKGWTALGGRAVCFDIEHLSHHGPVPEGCELVLQDVKTLHGSQFKDAHVILASPPCQEFSRYAMPFGALWREHHQMDDDGAPPGNYIGKPCPSTYLFWTCFRIQAEACKAAGRYIPMVVENVKGAQRFVGRSSWSHGSYHLWGDVPALMPINLKRRMKFQADCGSRMWRDRDVQRLNDGIKLGGGRSWSDYGKPGYKPFGFNTENEKATKNNGGSRQSASLGSEEKEESG